MLTPDDPVAGTALHCTDFGIRSAPVTEIEGIFTRPVTVLPDIHHSQTERQFKAIGRTRSDRAVFVVFTIRERDGHRYIRPISARHMHGEEIASYEKDNPDL